MAVGSADCGAVARTAGVGVEGASTAPALAVGSDGIAGGGTNCVVVLFGISGIAGSTAARLGRSAGGSRTTAFAGIVIGACAGACESLVTSKRAASS